MKKNKRRNTIMLLILLVCGITIGFAILTTTLEINGIGLIKGNKWDIHWENVDNEAGVTAQTPLIDSTKTTVTYEINLVNPGDYYEFTVDAVNAGSLDGVIIDIKNKFYESDGVTEIEKPAYISNKVTYSDGSPIEVGQRLNSRQTKTYKVRVDYSTSARPEELPETNKTIISKYTVEYIQADITVETKSFADDDWGTIADAVKTGNTSNYHVGDTKTVKMDMNNDGEDEEYTVRIANMSKPSECNQFGFSETACGFVVEFAEILENHRMNYNSGSYPPDLATGNKGGWKYSDMRAYLNNGVYVYDNTDYLTTGFLNKLPADLRKVIIDTNVVTGLGWDENSSSNEYSIVKDKIYLISERELYDTSFYLTEPGLDLTRQLDYYTKEMVSYEYYSPAIKKYNGTEASWWLRSTDASPYDFDSVEEHGGWPARYADYEYGVSPAFRIG